MNENREAVRTDDRLQPDPELHEGRSTMGRVLMTLVGAVVIIGLVVFGLSQHSAENQSVSGASSPAVPPAAAQNEAPNTNNPADQPPSTARGPSNADQARQNNAPGNTGQAPTGNTGGASAPATSGTGTR